MRDGLIAHFPFDGTEKGISLTSNMLDTSVWKVGVKGSQGNFSCNGTMDENIVIIGKNPWGVDEKLWTTPGNDEARGADGGWNVTDIPIDKTKTYRLSVWIKRTDVGDGRTYFGCQGSTVANLNNGQNNANPYFGSRTISELPEMEGQWLLWVAHIHPHNYTSTSSNKLSGIYDETGNKLTALTDYKWKDDAVKGGHRSYLYYSTSTNEEQYWCRPRMEIFDESAPTIYDLLAGRDEVINPVINSNTTINDEGIAVEEQTLNLLPHSLVNSYPTVGNGHGTYNTNQYNNNQFFTIGSVDNITDNIVTLSTVSHTIHTYDVLRPQVSGGGVIANRDYFIKKHSENSFSLHEYDGTPDGSKGYKVHDSINKDIRISISSNGFPVLWKGAPHKPNSGLVKEIIRGGYKGLHDCIRLHTEHRREGGSDAMAYGVYPPVVEGKTYTYSFKYRAVTPDTIGSNFHASFHTSGKSYRGKTILMDSYEWKTYSTTFVAPKTGGTNLYHWAESGTTIDISEIQMEEKAYPTSFCISSRPSSGVYKVRNMVGDKGTMHFAFKLNHVRNGGYAIPFRIANNNFVLSIIENRYLFGFRNRPTIEANKWYKATVTWDNSANKFRFYNNGTLLYERSCPSYFTNVARDYKHMYIGSGSDDGHYVFNGYIQDMSFYNRALTHEDVKLLATSRMQITKTGGVNCTVKESPNLPVKVVRFPLGEDTWDSNKLYKATTERHIVFQESSVWVGRRNINVVSNTEWDSWSTGYLKNINYNEISPPTGVRATVIGFEDNGSEGDKVGYMYCYSDKAPQEQGKVYTVSVWVKTLDSDFRIQAYTANNSEKGRCWSTSIEVPDDGRWHRIVWPSFTNPADSESDSLSFKYSFGNAVGQMGRTWICAPQMNEGIFSPPYHTGIRDAAKLSYTPSKMGIDLNTDDWTFGCFIKPIPGLMATTGRRYNPLEIGNYYHDNQVSQTMFHEHLPNKYNSVTYDNKKGVTSLGTLNLTEADMKRWIFVCFRKEGDILKMSSIGRESGLLTKSITKNWTHPFGDNVNVGCYDWDAGNVFVRDFIACKSCLTDEELVDMYKSMMRSKDGEAFVSGRIKEVSL